VFANLDNKSMGKIITEQSEDIGKDMKTKKNTYGGT